MLRHECIQAQAPTQITGFRLALPRSTGLSGFVHFRFGRSDKINRPLTFPGAIRYDFCRAERSRARGAHVKLGRRNYPESPNLLRRAIAGRSDRTGGMFASAGLMRFDRQSLETIAVMITVAPQFLGAESLTTCGN